VSFFFPNVSLIISPFAIPYLHFRDKLIFRKKIAPE
jgi:hypothetical protein